MLQKCPVLGTADIPGPSKDVCWCQDHAASHVQLDESTLGVGDGGAATQEMHSGVPRLPNPEVQGERRLQLLQLLWGHLKRAYYQAEEVQAGSRIPDS